MVLEKVLPAARGLLARQVVPSTLRNGDVLRRNYIIYAPPTHRMSFATKLVYGAVYIVGVTAIPVWVITHVDDYQGPRNKN